MAVNPNLTDYERPLGLPDDPLTNSPDGTLQADPNQPPVVTQGDPWATAPADGNWEAWFRANTNGQLSPAQLIALESTLAKHGIKVLRNAAGVAGKITLPNGQIVDVIEKAGAGGTRFQWLTDEGGAAATGGGAVNAPDADWFATNLPPPDAFTAPSRPDYLQGGYTAPEFVAPTAADLEADPGYRVRLDAAQRGLERSAAAKGSLLSGGFVGQTMPRELQKLASAEFDSLYKRRMDAFTTNAGLNYGARQLNENAYQNDVTNAQNQYNTRYRTWRDLMGDQFRLAELGASATAAGRPS